MMNAITMLVPIELFGESYAADLTGVLPDACMHGAIVLVQVIPSLELHGTERAREWSQLDVHGALVLEEV